MTADMTVSFATGTTLLRRVFVANASVVLIAGVVLAISPVTVSWPVVFVELVVLAAGLGLLVFANLVLLRRAFAPLTRLTADIRRIDLMRPGLRVPKYSDDDEVVQLTEAFNEMLERLEEERRRSVGAALGAQESERRRVAQELHDEIGQSLTAIDLRLEAAIRGPEQISRADLRDIQAIAAASVDEVRAIARRLRPEMLDDLGVASALVALTEQVATNSGIEVRRSLDPDIGELGDEVGLVVYRVAQESLTNVARHSGADTATLVLASHDGGVLLRVDDNGRGIDGAVPGSGMQGMRERAVLIGARLEVGASPSGGTRVELHVPPESLGGSAVSA